MSDPEITFQVRESPRAVTRPALSVTVSSPKPMTGNILRT